MVHAKTINTTKHIINILLHCLEFHFLNLLILIFFYGNKKLRIGMSKCRINKM